MRINLIAILFLSMVGAPALALEVRGQVHSFESANGIGERCVELEPFPGAHYSDKDREVQEAYCAIDFRKVALCPKLWSTSPGTIIYALEGEADAQAIADFEKRYCADGHHAKEVAREKLATFKVSVNGRGTSATYAPSSWVYFHLSRYLDTNSYVPPSVYRDMDRQVHEQRVTQRGLAIAGSRHGLRMLTAGWKHLEAVESGALGGSAAREALKGDGKLIYGVLLDNKGDRYGPEINGTRESGWGSGQNYDFQQTPAFLALRSEMPVVEAARFGVREARKNPQMAKAVPADLATEQVVLWMQDLLEITLLDYLLNQQDRIGNIDWRWYWYWVEDGKLKHDHAHGSEPPPEIAGFNPRRLKRTAINDNDAGVRPGYTNFTRRTDMLEGLRHYHPGLYSRFYRLARDLESRGEAYRWLREVAGLSEREADGIAGRAAEALATLVADCESGRLALDLVPAKVLAANPEQVESPATSCRPDTP